MLYFWHLVLSPCLLRLVLSLCRHRHDPPSSSCAAQTVVDHLPYQRVAGKDGLHTASYNQDSPGTQYDNQAVPGGLRLEYIDNLSGNSLRSQTGWGFLQLLLLSK